MDSEWQRHEIYERLSQGGSIPMWTDEQIAETIAWYARAGVEIDAYTASYVLDAELAAEDMHRRAAEMWTETDDDEEWTDDPR
jgi:hypothetical protein